MAQNKPVLIDSCIINHLLSKEEDLAKQTELLLENLKEDHDLYISAYTHHEILRSLDTKKKTKAQAALEAFITVPQTKERLQRATRLYSVYAQNAKVKERLHSISEIDIFIGSLIFTEHQPLLLTSDYNDFPRPFFEEEKYERIDYKKGKTKKASLYYYFLKANLGVLADTE